MIVGVPKEIKSHENRISVVPGGVEALVAQGHQVLVEKDGGVGSGFEDSAYTAVGAEIVARVTEGAFDALDAPILRITNRDINQPYATNLEQLVMPSVRRIVEAARAVVNR